MSLWCRPRLIPYSGVYGVTGADAPVDSRVRGLRFPAVLPARWLFRGRCASAWPYFWAVMNGGLVPCAGGIRAVCRWLVDSRDVGSACWGIRDVSWRG